MSNVEILCRRNAKGIDTTSAGRSTKIVMDTAHINAGCYGINDIAQCLLDSYACDSASALERLKRDKYKIIGDRVQQTDGLLNDVYRLVIEVSHEMNWKIKETGQDKIKALTRLAIEGATRKPVCKRCDGTKFVENKPCSTCSATGLRRDNGHVMAKKLGVNQSSWSRTWQYRYADVVAMLQTIMTRAGKKINYQIYSE